MEWTEFKRNLSRAEIKATTAHNLNNQNTKKFWEGYLQGLRRRYHGEKFRTAKEHKMLMIKTTDNCELSQKIRALGYESGYMGESVSEADMKLVYLFYVPPVPKQES